MVHLNWSLCVFAVVAALAGCATHQNRVLSLANSANAFRQQFNADKQKLRVVALLSPT